MADEPLDSLTDTIIRLDECRIPYMITGSVAAQMYGLNRATQDVDIVVDIVEDDAPALYAQFYPDYYIDQEMVADSARTGLVCNIISLTLGGKFDLIPLNADDPFELGKFERRVPIDWNGYPVWVINPADLVLSKLEWSRGGNSSMQLADVREIMTQGLFDEHDAYFQQWLDRRQLRDLLDAARAS